MIKLLPFIVIPILILAGLGYWRFVATNQDSSSPQTTQQDTSLVEVPKTLPNTSLEDRVKALEDANSKLVTQINGLKTSTSQAPVTNSLESRLVAAEGAVTELKARVSSLEKPTSSTSTSKAPLYIPLGASGGPWLYADFTSLNEYQVSINPDNYSGYTGMQLEVNFRLVGSPGTGYVRLYNVTDKSVVASEISTTNTSFGVLASSVFKLTSGQKLYTIQVKSTSSQDLYIQSARIKVNF